MATGWVARRRQPRKQAITTMWQMPGGRKKFQRSLDRLSGARALRDGLSVEPLCRFFWEMRLLWGCERKILGKEAQGVVMLDSTSSLLSTRGLKETTRIHLLQKDGEFANASV